MTSELLPTPAPPVKQELSLPALLSAIGGLGLNVAGLLSKNGRGGAAGQQALGLSSTLQEQGDKQTKRDQDKNIGQALKARLGEITNADAAKQIATAIDNEQLPEGQAVFYHQLSLQKQDVNQRKADERLSHYDDAQIQKGLGDYINTRGAAAKDVIKNLPPNYTNALHDQAFFASQEKPFGSALELQQAYNARKEAPRKLNAKEAQALFDKYDAHLNEQRAPVAIAGKQLPTALTQFFGAGQAPRPTDAFANWAQKQLSPEEIAAGEAAQAELKGHRAAIDEAHRYRRALANPLTRSTGRSAAEAFLSGAGAQDSGALPAPRAGASTGGPDADQTAAAQAWLKANPTHPQAAAVRAKLKGMAR